jgi:hypothetical protein
MPLSARRVLLSLCLALSLLPLRAPAAEREDRLAEATRAFRQASGGDKAAAGRAEALFAKLAAETPDDPVVLAYAGAAAAMTGNDAASPIDAMKRTEAGLDRIDLALRKLGPQHDAPRPGALPPRLETLLVAASTFLEVPDAVFHRRADGRAAVEAALAHPAYPHLPPPVQARFQWLAARGERKAPAERAALEKVIALDPAGELAGRARARLAEVSP